MSNDNISAIDKAIQAANARKAAKAGDNTGVADATATQKEPKPAKEPKAPAKPKLSDEEKAAKQAEKDAARAAAKLVRDAARAAKKAAKEADKKAPHMSKVEKAAAKLPAITDAAQTTIDDITANFAASEVAAIAAHLTHFNRVKATELALAQDVGAGDIVEIVSGDSRFTGSQGTVVKAQRIRCYVEVEGAKKPVYLFTSNVRVITKAPVVAEEAAPEAEAKTA